MPQEALVCFEGFTLWDPPSNVIAHGEELPPHFFEEFCGGRTAVIRLEIRLDTHSKQRGPLP